MVDRNKDDVVSATQANTDASGALAQGFGQFCRCAKFSDVALLDAAGNRIAAHRLVLSAGSRKFNDLLSRDGAVEIYCGDIEPACLHVMLEYLYTSHCAIQVHNAVQLLSTALLYGCDELESMCSLYIHMQLNSSTCCFFFAEAQKYKVEHIAIKALYVASMDFQNVIRSQSFFDLSLENLTALLGSPKLAAIHKMALCKAGCAWITKDTTRLDKLKDVLMCIQTRPTAPSDELQLMNFLKDGKTSSDELGEEMEWNSTRAQMTMGPGTPFFSRPSADQGSQNDRCPAPSDVHAAHQFLKDLKSDEAEISTDASRMTTAINVALFADQLQQQNDAKRLEAADSVKTRPTEDNASSETSSARKPKTRRGRTRKGSGKVAQPFTCQVEGCTTDLHGLKEYHIRYKICNHHLKVSSIMKDGKPQRFCQQCGRFHLLEEFDNNKRSCRTRLLRHNLRRRKRMHTKGAKENAYLSSVGYPTQRLVYLSRDGDAHSTNVDKLYPDGRSSRCLQIISPAEMNLNPCYMFSAMPRSLERDQQKHERNQNGAEANNASNRLSYVKPDPGTNVVGEKGL